MAIADRIGVMNHGKLEQLGSAEDLYKRPASRFVATFIGKCNLLEGRVTEPGRFQLANGRAFGFSGQHAAGTGALCFRPEHARIATAVPADGNWIEASLRSVTYLGALTEYDLVAESGERLLVSAESDAPHAQVAPGAKVVVSWQPGNCVLVD